MWSLSSKCIMEGMGKGTTQENDGGSAESPPLEGRPLQPPCRAAGDVGQRAYFPVADDDTILENWDMPLMTWLRFFGGLTALFLFTSAPAWAAPGQKHPHEKYITPMEAAEILVQDKGQPFLLDVRNGWEYEDFHIRGAKNIPVQELDRSENLARLPKGRKIIVYCRTGVRGDRALSILSANGFDAVNVRGGIVAWWRDVLRPPSFSFAPFGNRAGEFQKRKRMRDFLLGGSGKSRRDGRKSSEIY